MRKKIIILFLAVFLLSTAICVAFFGRNNAEVFFIKQLLPFDIELEFGTTIFHEELAKKGKAGLDALLDASKTADKEGLKHIGSAISKIRDESLLNDLYEACNNKANNTRTRFGCICAIGMMQPKSQEAKKIIRTIFEDNTSEMQCASIWHFLKYGGNEALALAEKKYEEQDLNAMVKKRLRDALIDKKPDDYIHIYMTTINNQNESSGKRRDTWQSLFNIITDKEYFIKNKSRFAQLLKAVDENGLPDNRLRLEVWKDFYTIGEIFPLELYLKDEKKAEVYTHKISHYIACKIMAEQSGDMSGKKRLSYSEIKSLSNQEAKEYIIKWNPNK